MASEHERVARGVAWTALLVLFTCFAVGLCRPPKTYGSRGHRRVVQHLDMVTREAPCKFPKPTTICVQDIYPNESKKYTPHCTVVHRCGPDTGCCLTEVEHCQPKSIQVVERYFLVLELDPSGVQQTGVETLTFDNHTECECRSKYDPIR